MPQVLPTSLSERVVAPELERLTLDVFDAVKRYLEEVLGSHLGGYQP